MVRKFRDKLNRASVEDMVCENLHTPETYADQIIDYTQSGIDKVFAIVPENEVTKKAFKRAKRDFLSRCINRLIVKLQEILNVK